MSNARKGAMPRINGLLLLTVWLCAAFAFVCACACAFPTAAYASSDDKTTVRVGYYENEVFQEGAQEGAVRTGYAYEYYRKLSEYTGWDYEYVYGNYADLYQMLLDGKVDLLAGLAWKKERVDLIGYPDEPMGHEDYSLVKHDTDEDIDAEPASFAGKKIGVLDSAMVDVLNKYLDAHDVKADVVNISDADFGTFYLDALEHPDRYDGKTIHARGRAFRMDGMPANCYVFGRHVLTCCAADIGGIGFLCKYRGSAPEPSAWIYLDAKVEKSFSPLHNTDAIVLIEQKVTAATPPQEELVYFN